MMDYIFESGGKLIRIPRLPVTLDNGVASCNLSLFRRMTVGEPIAEADARHVPESLLLVKPGGVQLYLWGEVLCAQ